MTKPDLLTIDGVTAPLRLRRTPRAKRVSLRVDPITAAVVLVVPARVPLSHAVAFARDRAEWLNSRIAAVPAPIPFADGTILPFLGQDYRLHHAPTDRRGVWSEPGLIHISGGAEHLPRRLTDWLKRRAREELLARATPMAGRIGRTIDSVRVGDPRSRWGSCNSRGRLAFSWRLVLCPSDVLSYVVGHEVAHLVEMNHSAAFWRVVEDLVPGCADARAWLKRHGAGLHRYG